MNRCFEPGICLGGQYEGSTNVNTAEECLNFCLTENDCKWFSFDPSNNNICSLSDSCPYVDSSCDGCINGQRECATNSTSDDGLYIMVAVGSFEGDPIDHVEIINAAFNESCPNLPAPYPLEIYESAAMTHQGKPILCGGLPITTDCHSYDHINNRWDLEPFMLSPGRRATMTAETRPGEWIIIGGEDIDYNVLDETLFFKDGIFTDGPKAPLPVFLGSGVMYDTKRLFLATAGTNGANSPMNFFLDIDTLEWTQIANRTLTPTYAHCSGTFYNSTRGELQIATISSTGIEVYSPQDDKWTSGHVSFPPGIDYVYDSSAVQQGSDSFLLIGGKTEAGYSGNIYEFNETGMNVIKPDFLAQPRKLHSTLAIPAEQAHCF